MESNRDEAIRCLRLAEKYLNLGDKEKAEKFGQKATKLYPLKEAEGKNRKIVSNIQPNTKLFLFENIQKIKEILAN